MWDLNFGSSNKEEHTMSLNYKIFGISWLILARIIATYIANAWHMIYSFLVVYLENSFSGLNQWFVKLILKIKHNEINTILLIKVKKIRFFTIIHAEFSYYENVSLYALLISSWSLGWYYEFFFLQNLRFAGRIFKLIEVCLEEWLLAQVSWIIDEFCYIIDFHFRNLFMELVTLLA